MGKAINMYGIYQKSDSDRIQYHPSFLETKPRRPKIRTLNFKNIISAPKNNKNMGMDAFSGKSIFDEEFF